MNSNFEWHLTNKLQGDQNWWKELATDCAFKIQNVSVFSWVTQGPQVLPDVVDVDGSVEGQGDHLRHLSHLEITWKITTSLNTRKQKWVVNTFNDGVDRKRKQEILSYHNIPPTQIFFFLTRGTFIRRIGGGIVKEKAAKCGTTKRELRFELTVASRVDGTTDDGRTDDGSAQTCSPFRRPLRR